MGCLCGHEGEDAAGATHPSAPAPAKDVFAENRKCRDVLFLLIFVAFWAGMFYVGGTAFSKGDPNRIIYGLDSQGHLCGQKNAGVNGTAGPDFTGRKHLYWLDYRDVVGGNITRSKRVCVADCPTNSTDFVCAYNSQYETDYFNSLTIAGKLNSARGSGPCYPVLLPTVSVLNKCFPQPPPGLTAFVDGAINASAAAPSTTASANATVDFEFVAQMAANLSKNKLQTYMSDLVKAWLVVLVCGVGGGVLFSVLWIAVLRFCAGVMAWSSILLVNLALVGCTLFCYAKAGKLNGQAIAQDLGADLPAALNPAASDRHVFLVVAYVMTAVSAVMLIITALLFRRIRIAVACLKVGSQAVAAMPLLMLFPALPFALLLALLAYWVAVAAFLYSAGDIVHAPDGSYSIVWNSTLRYCAIYHLFGLLWTWQFIAGLGYCVVAGAVASFYWCRGDRSRVPRCPIATALKRTLWYYLGCIALGSFIVAVVQFVRLVLEWVDRKARAASGGAGWLKYVMGCLQCVLWLVQKIVQFINKNAYILVAVKGTGYCDSASRAVALILSNAVRVAAVNTVGASLLWVGKVAVAALCGGAAFLMCDLPQYADPARPAYLSSPLFPVVFSAVFAYFIAAIFMNVYEMAIDAVLLCFCEDCERHDGDPQYAPPLLLTALGKAAHKETSVVPSAPPAPAGPAPPAAYSYSPSSPGPLQPYPPGVPPPMQGGWVAGPHGSMMSAPHRMQAAPGVYGFTR